MFFQRIFLLLLAIWIWPKIWLTRLILGRSSSAPFGFELARPKNVFKLAGRHQGWIVEAFHPQSVSINKICTNFTVDAIGWYAGNIKTTGWCHFSIFRKQDGFLLRTHTGFDGYIETETRYSLYEEARDAALNWYESGRFIEAAELGLIKLCAPSEWGGKMQNLLHQSKILKQRTPAWRNRYHHISPFKPQRARTRLIDEMSDRTVIYAYVSGEENEEKLIEREQREGKLIDPIYLQFEDKKNIFPNGWWAKLSGRQTELYFTAHLYNNQSKYQIRFHISNDGTVLSSYIRTFKSFHRARRAFLQWCDGDRFKLCEQFAHKLCLKPAQEINPVLKQKIFIN